LNGSSQESALHFHLHKTGKGQGIWMNETTRSCLAVDKVLMCLSTNPYRHLIRRWNWKTACLSACSRGTLIFLANISAGSSGALGAMLAEVCYRGLTSGFFGALTQAFRFAQPAWAASMIPMVFVPLVADSCEFALHGMRGTQRLGATVAVSVVFTAVSTLLESFAMRHGVLVMGSNSRSLLKDIRSLPKLLLALRGETRQLKVSIAEKLWRRHRAPRLQAGKKWRLNPRFHNNSLFPRRSITAASQKSGVKA
jgi:hypothetical protein